jgi:outer membrane protein assembly factor BamB
MNTPATPALRLFVLISVCFAAAARAAEWPQFRGPTGQGLAGDARLPSHWDGGKNRVWTVQPPGTGWSSPIVAGDRIFLTSAIPVPGTGGEPDHDLAVLALDAATGEPIWRCDLFRQKASEAPRIHKKNSHASPTPVFEDGRIYAHFGHMGTGCVDARDGRVLWSTRQHAYAPVHGNGGSPVLAGDLLVFTADAASDPAVIALRKRDGKTAWRTPRQSAANRSFSFCTPLVIDNGGRPQIIAPGSGVVQALNPRDGSEIWRVHYGQGYSVVPRPVFAGGLLYICTGYDKPELLAIRVTPDLRGDVTDSAVAWTQGKYIPHNPSPLWHDGKLYLLADNGILSCLDAATGEPFFQERCTGPASASPLLAGGLLYLTDERGMTAVVEPGTGLKIVARNDLEERVLASPVPLGSDLLLRTETALHRIGAR